jgi:saccharopine dehydrogenase (NAD+, L-lysine-forming)
VCQNDGFFTDLLIASRTLSKCDALKAALSGKTRVRIQTAQVDAADAPALASGSAPSGGRGFEPGAALPGPRHHDACLKAGAHYIDTANYEPETTAKFEYSLAGAYRDRLKRPG